jgi:hypothetical protein
MRRLKEIRDFRDDEYFDQLREEGSEVTSAGIFAVWKKENWAINVKDGIVETYKNAIFTTEGIRDLYTENVELVRLEEYFIINFRSGTLFIKRIVRFKLF